MEPRSGCRSHRRHFRPPREAGRHAAAKSGPQHFGSPSRPGCAPFRPRPGRRYRRYRHPPSASPQSRPVFLLERLGLLDGMEVTSRASNWTTSRSSFPAWQSPCRGSPPTSMGSSVEDRAGPGGEAGPEVVWLPGGAMVQPLAVCPAGDGQPPPLRSRSLFRVPSGPPTLWLRRSNGSLSGLRPWWHLTGPVRRLLMAAITAITLTCEIYIDAAWWTFPTM